MGANAQTTVQKFLSGAVLTAEQQNFSAATGAPVFATTVTRDAAFGGANKVLAEGQTCYLEDANVVQYYDGAAWATVGPAAASGLVLQIVTGTTTTAVSNSTGTFANTGLTATITPTSTSSKVLILVNHSQSSKSAANSGQGVDLELQAAGVSIATLGNGNLNTNTAALNMGGMSASILHSPATVSAVIYKTQFRSDLGVASVTVQQDSGMSSIVLMEISA